MIRTHSIRPLWLKSLALLASLGGLTVLDGLTPAAVAADPPSVKLTMTFKPFQSDVEYDVADPKIFDQCKVTAIREGKATGWIVTGPQGQTLRRFMDSNGDNIVDQWSYYHHGVEVYREVDTNFNNKADNYRWLNTGGSRWGIDANEDYKIDVWKVISAEEVSKIAIRSLVTQDAAALSAVLITRDDLKTLGIKGNLETNILTAVAEPAAKLRKAVSGSKIITPRTQWMRFDCMSPSAIPSEQIGATSDVLTYENAMAIIAYDETKTALVQIGELIRVGEVWKMTQIPLPIEGNLQVAQSGHLLQPVLPTGAAGDPTVAGGLDPKEAELLKELQELDAKAPLATASRTDHARFHTKRGELLVALRDMTSSDERRIQYTRQVVDGITAAVQVGHFPTGLERLKQLEADQVKKEPKAALSAYLTYRRMLAEYSLGMQEADNEGRQKIQERWLADLEQFVTDHPKAEDAADAVLQLAVAHEFSGKTDPAKKWYERLVADFAQTPPADRARGALRRLNLVGKQLTLSGPGLNGGLVDVKQLRGKVVVVLFWATWCKPCTEDLPQLKALYQEYRNRGFEVVGVNLDEQRQLVGQYLTQYSVPWLQIQQPKQADQASGLDGELAKSFGIISLPTMFLLDAEGKVINRSATVADIKTTLADTFKTDTAKKDPLRPNPNPATIKKN